MITEHAKLWSPSNASRWVFCRGCPQLLAELNNGNKSTIHTLEGEAAHWINEQVLTYDLPWQVVDSTYCDTVAPNGVLITKEMINFCKVFIDLVRNTPGSHNIEQRVDIPSIHPDCFGTVDHDGYDLQTATLYVDDFKYGWGIVDNWWQHTCYASGLIDTLGLVPHLITVVMRTIQPRPWHPIGPIREWRIKGDQLQPYIDQLHDAANDIFPELTSGEHCKNCRAILSCPANYRATLNAIDISDWPIDKERTNKGRELTILKHAKKTIENRLSAVESESEAELLAGGFIEGWAMGASKGGGKSTWNIDTEEIRKLGVDHDINLIKETPVTPIQAIKNGVPADIVKGHSKMPTQGVKLMPVESTLAYKVFKGE